MVSGFKICYCISHPRHTLVLEMEEKKTKECSEFDYFRSSHFFFFFCLNHIAKPFKEESMQTFLQFKMSNNVDWAFIFPLYNMQKGKSVQIYTYSMLELVFVICADVLLNGKMQNRKTDSYFAEVIRAINVNRTLMCHQNDHKLHNKKKPKKRKYTVSVQ